MLNLNRITSFRYDLREIMSHYRVDESVASSVMATVIAKGSRVSTASAKAYVKGQEKAGMYPKEVTNEVCDLLERFSKRR